MGYQDYINQMVAQQGDLYALTKPLREQGVSTLQSVLAGAPASSLPAYAPNRAAIENQFGKTAEMIRSSMPRGGQLNSQLADLMLRRGEGVAKLEADVRQDALNKALNLGFGSGAGNMSSLGTAASLTANQENQEAARSGAAISGGMQGLGLLAALLAGWGK